MPVSPVASAGLQAETDPAAEHAGHCKTRLLQQRAPCNIPT